MSADSLLVNSNLASAKVQVRDALDIFTKVNTHSDVTDDQLRAIILAARQVMSLASALREMVDNELALRQEFSHA